jgi:formate/nitrite transporter FocA (FNT family)
LGFEHSVANMYLIPIGMLSGAGVDLVGFAHNLLWVSLGNVVGGAGGVALVYWIIYLRPGVTRSRPDAGAHLEKEGRKRCRSVQ